MAADERSSEKLAEIVHDYLYEGGDFPSWWLADCQAIEQGLCDFPDCTVNITSTKKKFIQISWMKIPANDAAWLPSSTSSKVQHHSQ